MGKGRDVVPVRVAGEAPFDADLAGLARHGEVVQQLRARQQGPGGGVEFAAFPGGATLLRSVLAYLEALGDSSVEKEASGAEGGAAGDAAAGAEEDEEPDLSCLARPALGPDTLGDYLEAAAVLRSPDLARNLVNSSACCEELTSRRALVLLEQVVMWTGAPPEAGGASAGEGAAALPPELSEAMEEAFAEVVRQLAARLDPRDFRLGPSLAKGSIRASLEVLRTYADRYVRYDNDVAISLSQNLTLHSGHSGSSVVNTTASMPGKTASVAGTRVGTSVCGKVSSQRIEWTEHQFASNVIEGHLRAHAEAARALGTLRAPPAERDTSLTGAEVDDGDMSDVDDSASVFGDLAQNEDDIEEAICDTVPDAALARTACLVTHLDHAIVPQMLAAAMVRALLLASEGDSAAALFQAAFARSPKIRDMVVCGAIPAEFLQGVVRHPGASVTLRRMLAEYESSDAEGFCALVEGILFGPLAEEEHCQEAIVRHDLMVHLILWTRSGGVRGGARLGALGFAGGDDPAPAAARLRQIGVSLFRVAFIAHGGFLPPGSLPGAAAPEGAADPAPEGGGDGAREGERGQEGAGQDCLWDSGALDLPLLECAPSTEDARQLARVVLLRNLHQTRSRDVQAVAQLWPMGCWSLCRDPALIKRAMDFLCICWRAIMLLPGVGDVAGPPPAAGGPGAHGVATVDGFDGMVLVGKSSRRVVEELLFHMFADLEFWRLPHKDLLSPWVPGPVLACHMAAQCNDLEDRQLVLVEETRENLQEITRLRGVINQLTARLEATDTRSLQCMLKQTELVESVRQLR